MIKLIKPQSNFTTIPNHIINDNRLSFKAKGLFLYLISKPDGWNFSADRIANDCNDGKKSVLSGLKELEINGLLTRKNIRINGVFKGFDYSLSFDFIPCTQNGSTVTPCTQKRQTQKRQTQNGSINKDSLSKKDLVIEERENINSNLDLIPIDYSMHIDSFLDELCNSKAIKNPLSYRSKILNALSDSNDKNHNRTKLAYDDFLTRYRPSPILPAGVNIFDVIGRD